MNLTATIVAVLAAAALALGGLAWWQSGRVDALRDDNAALTRSVAALTAERQQAVLARDVARAEADRFRGQAEEYTRLREDLLRGDDDTPIPPWLAAYLDRLLGAARGDLPRAPH